MSSANTTELEMFYDPPATTKDPNQSGLRDVLDGLEERPGSWRISLRGFHASCVDLGWLCDRATQWWLDHDVTVEKLCEKIREELPEVVQRLKQWGCDEEDGSESIAVGFKTKDDRSWYFYEFSVHVGDDDGDEEEKPEDLRDAV